MFCTWTCLAQFHVERRCRKAFIIIIIIIDIDIIIKHSGINF